MFEIIREKLGRPVTSWKRFSDGCDGQFQSRFGIVDLMEPCKRFSLEHASYDYFEANEGKNISETIGPIIKCAYVCAMLRHKQGICCLKDNVSIKIQTKNDHKKDHVFPC